MSYININKALESIDLIAKNDGEKFDKDSARYAIQTTETEDVVPVVRCKDCIYNKGKSSEFDNIIFCHKELPKARKLDDFCSYGERKNDNGKL